MLEGPDTHTIDAPGALDSMQELRDVIGRMQGALWRVNLAERRATIWMRTVSRRADDARHLIVAGAFYVGG